uniref:ABC transporter domain-containing protein n=1 Tax=Graphocephala atropunctata TaxID=36148 RepID=A0A1B6K9B6_9HEMI
MQSSTDEGETVLSWDIKSLTVTTTTHSLLKRDVVHRHSLLRNVRGYATSGSLLAIMGPSGAGKTTLLAALNQRITGDLVGEVMINGREVDKDLMVRISGFVPQQDLAVSCLSALEHLTFTATLKLDRRVSLIQKQRIICGLIKDLGLSSCSCTQISALSGGERKRLSLATQVLTDPPILYCDEPTTGLDSYNASSVVTVLQTLTKRGMTIVCTIHQPSSDVYTMFDQVCLLVPGGSQAYFGTVAGAQQFFSSLGMECPSLFNPADFLLSKLNSTPNVTRVLCDKFFESSLSKTLSSKIDNIKKASIKNQCVFGIEEKFLKFYSVCPPTQKTQLRWLMWRSGLAMFRDSHRIMLRFIMYMMIGLFVSSPYVSVKLDQAGIQSLQGFHYAVITETIFIHTYSILFTFPAEIAIMLREINNGVYQPGPYYFSKAIVLLPRVILETIFFCMIAFMLVGVEGGSLGFLMFSSPVIASAIVSTAYGCCMSAMFENIASASLLVVPIDFITYTFSGIFLHLSTVPLYLRWIKYISRFYYGLEAMSIMQWTKIGSIPCSDNTELPCIMTGVGVLQKYGYSPNNLWLDFTGMTITFAVLHAIGFFAFRCRSQRQSVY